MQTRTIAAPTVPVVLRGVRNNALLSFLIAGLADWLFFRHPVGVSVAVFLCIFVTVVALAHGKLVRGRTLWASIGVLGASLLPVILQYGMLPLLVALAGASFFLLAATGHVSFDFLDGLQKFLRLLFGGPFQMVLDLTRASALLRRSDTPVFGRNQFITWATTLGLGTVFLVLFATANPLIEKWVNEIDILSMVGQLDVVRVLFWVVCMALSWPFLRSRLGAMGIRKPNRWRDLSRPKKSPATSPIDADQLVWPLVAFNILFLVQTWLDLTYLWGGVDLPSGLTYAEYAHRGAYALIAASALAAAFVLLVMRTGSDAEHMPTVRMLVFVWMGQGIFLVFSSIHRLSLYVEVYALTYWRAFALVGMALISFGLASIVARIALHRSNAWLVTLNSAVAAAALYVCSLVNTPAAIADYNVAHSHQLTGKGVRLDRAYLCSLGPQALPAIDRFTIGTGITTENVIPCRAKLVLEHKKQMSNWRGWSFYGWQLTKYLNSQDQANLPRDSQD